jgi:hypothetical protein
LLKLCSSEAGFANVPADDIARKISLEPRQRQELGALIFASGKAAEKLHESCPTAVPNTLSARLDAVDARLHAPVDAIDTIRPHVQTFFASLTPTQKTVLNTDAPTARAAPRRR